MIVQNHGTKSKPSMHQPNPAYMPKTEFCHLSNTAKKKKKNVYTLDKRWCDYLRKSQGCILAALLLV